jgi:hypothetical protein
MIVRIDPPIPMLTPKGKGLCHFMRDYGIEFDDLWTVAIDATGEIWTFKNNEVRFEQNITAGRLTKKVK